MVNVILNLAKSLGMTVIAEGIETEEQALKLKELGCHYAQGFLFSRAMSGENIPEMIKTQPYKKTAVIICSNLIISLCIIMD